MNLATIRPTALTQSRGPIIECRCSATPVGQNHIIMWPHWTKTAQFSGLTGPNAVSMATKSRGLTGANDVSMATIWTTISALKTQFPIHVKNLLNTLFPACGKKTCRGQHPHSLCVATLDHDWYFENPIPRLCENINTEFLLSGKMVLPQTSCNLWPTKEKVS